MQATDRPSHRRTGPNQNALSTSNFFKVGGIKKERKKGFKNFFFKWELILSQDCMIKIEFKTWICSNFYILEYFNEWYWNSVSDDCNICCNICCTVKNGCQIRQFFMVQYGRGNVFLFIVNNNSYSSYFTFSAVGHQCFFFLNTPQI